MIEVEGQQRRTMPVTGASGGKRHWLCSTRNGSAGYDVVAVNVQMLKMARLSTLKMARYLADVLWNEELTFRTVRSTADLRVSVFARMRLSADAFLGEWC